MGRFRCPSKWPKLPEPSLSLPLLRKSGTDEPNNKSALVPTSASMPRRKQGRMLRAAVRRNEEWMMMSNRDEHQSCMPQASSFSRAFTVVTSIGIR
uniref:p0047B08.7 protein n=1 Tax=Oryza sativa subsp. japonica TaxID=39947 RepID=Q94JA4_ORYSJ|nr:P0047B08.7 [Oryza sativa Japonica Group]